VQTLGEMIVEWGMRVIDAIGQAFSAVRDAVSEVGEMVSALVEWVKDYVKNSIMSLIEPILNHIEEWRTNVQNELLDAYNEFKNGDNVSTQSIKALRNAFMGELYYAITALAMGLLGTLMAIEGISLGTGSAAMIVVPFAIGIVAEELIDHEEGAFDQMISLDPGIDSLLNLLESILSGSFFEEENVDTTDSLSFNSTSNSMSNNMIETIFSFFVHIIEVVGFFGMIGSLAVANPMEKLSTIGAAVGSFVVGIAALVFSPAATAADSAGETEKARLFAGFAAALSGLGIVLGGGALLLSPKASVGALGGLGLGIAVIPMFTNIYEVLY